METLLNLTSYLADSTMPCVPTVNTITIFDEEYEPVLVTRKCGCLNKIGWIAPADSHVNNTLKRCVDHKDNSRVYFLRLVHIVQFQITIL